MSTKVVTNKVRFSYVTIKEPRAMEDGQTPKYSIQLLIPKSDKAGVKKIQDAIAAAKESGKAKWGGKIPANLKTPLRDGDAERPEDETYAGHFFMNANAVRQPGVVDKSRQEIFDLDEVYSGCYGRASVNMYPFTGASKGIACGLNNLQMLMDGPRLDGATSAEEDFDDEFAGDDAGNGDDLS